MSHKGELRRAGVPLTPGSVIQLDSLLMRTRFDNWVSDGVFAYSDEDLAYDLARGFEFAVLFDAGAASRHNHFTRDIKAPGKCPACDRYHEHASQDAVTE